MFNLIALTVGTNNENMNFDLNISMSHILPGTSTHKNREINMYICICIEVFNTQRLNI